MSYIDSPPPPAYSEEFDRKVSAALQQSLSTPQPDIEEEWETWDDRAFEAAAQALPASDHLEKYDSVQTTSYAQGGSSGSRLPPPVEPLKINKKGSDPGPPPKPRPSWLDAVDATSGESTAGPRNVTALPPSNIPPPQVSSDEEEEEEEMYPPPAFTPQAPSLDGPPYEQVVSPQWVGNRSPPSPPVSPVYATPVPLVPVSLTPGSVMSTPRQYTGYGPQGDVHRRIPRNSLPVAPQHTPQYSTPQRPVSEHPAYKYSPMPISTFDPSIAYNQGSEFDSSQRPARDQGNQDYIRAAASFYNVAVASQLTSRPPPQGNYPPTSNHSQLTSNHTARERPDSTRYGFGTTAGMAPGHDPNYPPVQRFTQYNQYHNMTTNLRR